MLWTSSVIYLVTPLLWLVKTPADMNELRDLHSSALILIARKIIMAMLVIRRGFRTLVLHYYMYCCVNWHIAKDIRHTMCACLSARHSLTSNLFLVQKLLDVEICYQSLGKRGSITNHSIRSSINLTGEYQL